MACTNCSAKTAAWSITAKVLVRRWAPPTSPVARKMKNVEAGEVVTRMGRSGRSGSFGGCSTWGGMTDEAVAFIECTPFESVRPQPRLLEK
jgi:hypothetical protein